MPSINVFVSFEFDKDVDLKNNFYEQANTLSPHRIVNCSLNEAYPDRQWQERARAAISQSDVVVVLVGPDTHNAPGVKTEVNIARRLGKAIFQVVPQKRPYQGLTNLAQPIRWKWRRINAKIEELV